jgi:LPS-assembly protein
MRKLPLTSLLAVVTAFGWITAGPGARAASDLYGNKPSKEAAKAAKAADKAAKKPAKPAEKGPSDQQIEFTADQVIYDKDLDSVTAQGHVVVHRDDNTVKADTVIYNLSTGSVTANGNVQVADKSGNTLYANVVELDDELRTGFIKAVHIVFNDNSRAAATEGTRDQGSITRLRNAIYSPCNICDDDPDSKPLWDVKARRVIYDENKHTITYHDAFLEFFGIPVVYTPYFKHADPTVKRQSGFLAPDVGNSTQLGLQARIPYYWNISSDKDFTFSPLFTTGAGVVIAGEYRQLVNAGPFSIEGGITRVQNRSDTNEPLPGKQYRGYVKVASLFNIDSHSRWGVDGEWTTDDTFLRRYGIDRSDTLTSRAYYERFDGRSYGEVDGYSFQGLRVQDIAGQTPYALPWVSYHFVSKPMFLNSVLNADFDLLDLQRTAGPDTRRISMNTSIDVPYTSPAGDIYRLTVRARGDIYQTRGLDAMGNPTEPNNDQTTTRFLPQVAMEWRYPFIRRSASSWQILEPIAVVAASKNGGNPATIPNEDSSAFELNTLNLFSVDRFSGLDVWEGGQRVAYGLRYEYHWLSGASGGLTVGQSYRFSDIQKFGPDTGLAHNFSDYVARFDLNLPPYVNMFYRLRLDRRTLALRRQEVYFVTGTKVVNLTLGYLDLRQTDPVSEFTNRREIQATGNVNITSKWSIVGNIIQDVGPDPKTIKYGIGLQYEDECFKIRTQVRRNFTRDRDVQPTTTISINIVLTHLGS